MFHAGASIRHEYAAIPRIQPLIVSTSSDEEDRITALKMKLIHRSFLSGRNLIRCGSNQFVLQHVSPHRVNVTISRQYAKIESYTARLKQLFYTTHKWTVDTFHGLGTKYLQLYLDEHCFRVNCEASCDSAFHKLIRLSMTHQIQPITLYQTKNLIHIAPSHRTSYQFNHNRSSLVSLFA